jgi:hypothetical protein
MACTTNGSNIMSDPNEVSEGSLDNDFPELSIMDEFE